MLNKLLVITASLTLISILSACSNVKPYPEQKQKNVHIKTKTDSGSYFTDIKTSVDIYSVNKKCKTQYLGTRELKQASLKLGLPENKRLYLNFSFLNSGFFSSTNSTMSYETLIDTRRGAQYFIELSYLDDMYNMEIWEKRSRKSAKRELDSRSFDECKPTK